MVKTNCVIWLYLWCLVSVAMGSSSEEKDHLLDINYDVLRDEDINQLFPNIETDDAHYLSSMLLFHNQLQPVTSIRVLVRDNKYFNFISLSCIQKKDGCGDLLHTYINPEFKQEQRQFDLSMFDDAVSVVFMLKILNWEWVNNIEKCKEYIKLYQQIDYYNLWNRYMGYSKDSPSAFESYKYYRDNYDKKTHLTSSMDQLLTRSILFAEDNCLSQIIDSILCGNHADWLSKEITRKQLKFAAQHKAMLTDSSSRYEISMFSFPRRFNFSSPYFKQEFLTIVQNLEGNAYHFVSDTDIFAADAPKDGAYYILKTTIKERIKRGYGFHVHRKNDHFYFTHGPKIPDPAN